ncbi:hypothetical protein ACL02P_03485 [Paenibacillus sp. MB22_1]|uniref:hypothetical protein n=1 Tax=Paenibacillus sp. MB22_1 TaxID=3383121 RepID=UPI00399F12EB
MGVALIPKIAVKDQRIQHALSSFSVARGELQPFYSQIVLSKNKHITAPINDLTSLLTVHEFAAG